MILVLILILIILDPKEASCFSPDNAGYAADLLKPL